MDRVVFPTRRLNTALPACPTFKKCLAVEPGNEATAVRSAQ